MSIKKKTVTHLKVTKFPPILGQMNKLKHRPEERTQFPPSHTELKAKPENTHPSLDSMDISSVASDLIFILSTEMI